MIERIWAEKFQTSLCQDMNVTKKFRNFACSFWFKLKKIEGEKETFNIN